MLKFDLSKGITLISYVLSRMDGKADFIHICKILYFADQKHLAKYGSMISDDDYVAMKDGPVPSGVYDILKSLRGEGAFLRLQFNFETYFKLENNSYTVSALVQPDLNALSESERECLDEAIRENRSLTYGEISTKSHDAAWHAAERDNDMPLLAIAHAAGADAGTLDYIRNHYEVLSAGRNLLRNVVGKWPGDESDEEIGRALEELS